MTTGLNSTTTISLLSDTQLSTMLAIFLRIQGSSQARRSRIRTNLDTLALRQTNPRLLLPNHEHIALPRRERVVNCVFDVHDVETTVVSFTMRDDSDAAHVASTRDHGNGAGIELDEFENLAGSEIDLDCVVDLDERVRVADSVYQKIGGQSSAVSHPCMDFRYGFFFQTLAQRLTDEFS